MVTFVDSGAWSGVTVLITATACLSEVGILCLRGGCEH
jgi:hypothetical protein